jgi:hypothetical protein
MRNIYVWFAVAFLLSFFVALVLDRNMPCWVMKVVSSRAFTVQ